jgi:DNA mismatch endonuclease (patch repair protein)
MNAERALSASQCLGGIGETGGVDCAVSRTDEQCNGEDNAELDQTAKQRAEHENVMARIRSRDTKPELALRRGLFAAGARGWRCHNRQLPGRPDVAFTRWKGAVFVDGCFWHGHPDFFTPGKSGAYWDAKIARTQERDRHANEALAADGWIVLRLWDFEIEANLSACVSAVLAALSAAGSTTCSPVRARAA